MILIKHLKSQEKCSQFQWKHIATLIIENGKLNLIKQCLIEAHDNYSILFLYSASGRNEQIKKLDEKSESNIIFLASFSIDKYENCIQFLIKKELYLEATIMNLTYYQYLFENELIFKR
jgi:hypothetical protein